MILAAGLSPAWQHILVFERLAIGEVNRAREVHWCASGKVLNAAMALGRLGARCRVLSLLGGQTGENVEREIAALGLEGCWIRTSHPTRVCTTLLDRSSGTVTELVENAGPVSEREICEFLDSYGRLASSSEVVVLTGSLPEGSPVTLYRDLLAASKCREILDARGAELLQALPEKPFVVKPNREELARTVGRKFGKWGDLLSAVDSLRDRGAQWVVVTGGRGLVVVRGPEGTWFFRPPRISSINPIGSGDCLAGGMAWALANGAGVPEAVRFGMGVAAQNAAELLPSRIDRETSSRFADQVVSENPPSPEAHL